VEHVLVNQRFI